MSAAGMPAADADAETTRIQAQRAEHKAAWEAQAAHAQAVFDERVDTVRDIAEGRGHGRDLGEPLRLLGEAANALKNLKQDLANLPHRWAREDAGEVKQEKARLRETKPASAIRWGQLAMPLLKAMGVNSEFGRDDPRLLDHAMLIELAIGEDLEPAEQQAEAFNRLVRCVGSYVATDLKLAAVEKINGIVTRMVLAGQCLPPIAMPEDEEAQRLHLRLHVIEREMLAEHSGWEPVPSLEDQQRARQLAWRRLLDEERQALPKGMSAEQRARQISKLLPEWAAWAGAA